MAGKRVLGDDPFAAGGGAGAEGEGDGTATVTGAKARASKRPAAKSAEKEPKPSKRAPATAKARASTAPRAKGASDTETAPEAEPTPTEVPALKLGSDALRAPAVPREAQMFAEAPAGAHPEVTPASATPASAVAEQLASIESQLAELMARAQGDAAASRALDRLRERLGAAAPQPAPGAQGESPEAALVARHRDAMEIDHDGAREVLGTEFYRRHWGRSAMRDREEEVDDFGLDQKFSARWRPLFDFLYERWWRVEVRGVERVPERGAVILCANHAGAVPYDGVMLSAALRREHAGIASCGGSPKTSSFARPFSGCS